LAKTAQGHFTAAKQSLEMSNEAVEIRLCANRKPGECSWKNKEWAGSGERSQAVLSMLTLLALNLSASRSGLWTICGGAEATMSELWNAALAA
jgi:hypothetical protein